MVHVRYHVMVTSPLQNKINILKSYEISLLGAVGRRLFSSVWGHDEHEQIQVSAESSAH